MFKIDYRIVDDINELKQISVNNFDNEFEHISGFFRISFGKHKEGNYFHSGLIRENEVGTELLDFWFNQLLNVIELLQSTNSYAAIKELETMNKWIEFKKEGENVKINVAIDTNNSLTDLVLSQPNDSFLYLKPLDYTISFEEMKKIIKTEAEKFMSELKDINIQLLNTQMALKLNKRYSTLLAKHSKKPDIL